MKPRRQLQSAILLICWTCIYSLASTGGGSSASSLPPLAKTMDSLSLARQAMQYIDASTDPFHAVKSSIDLLQQAGFVALDDARPYRDQIRPGGKYYFTRNRSSLVAFHVAADYVAGNGAHMIGCHTDSPNLRVKPRSKRVSVGCLQVGVECYGGGLWHTWFDRCLGVSGRVMVRNGDKIEQKLVQIRRALLRVSNLAIHLQTAKEREAFVVNKEDHLSPIIALQAQKSLTGPSSSAPAFSDAGSAPDAAPAEPSTPSSSPSNSSAPVKDGWTEHQEPALLQVLAHELNVATKDIIDFELSLFDIQKACLGGVYSEFIHSARLDNLASCFMAVQALVDHVQDDSAIDTSSMTMIVLYDHEEVGSGSAIGAASPLLKDAVRRITAALAPPDAVVEDLYERCIHNSFCISCDQAHAVHPNYASKHEQSHRPQMNQGMVIKRNSNQRYATTTVDGVLMREVARKVPGLPPLQEFIVRQDCGCGSTIGPLMSAATGIRCIDMGCPQLSMHSIRETMGVTDLTYGLQLFRAFFQHYNAVQQSVEH